MSLEIAERREGDGVPPADDSPKSVMAAHELIQDTESVQKLLEAEKRAQERIALAKSSACPACRCRSEPDDGGGG